MSPVLIFCIFLSTAICVTLIVLPWLYTSYEIIKQRNCFHMKNLIIALCVILALNVIQAISFVSNVRSLASNHILDNTTENTLSLTNSISRQFRAWNSLVENPA
jgi:hypothetical protein